MRRRGKVGKASSLRRTWIALFPRSFLRRGNPTRAELGRVGEELAARALLRAGWRIDGRRVRTPRAEVDLWVRAADRALAVEVKTRRLRRIARGPGEGHGWDLRWRPEYSLSARQRERLVRAARHLARVSGRPHEVALIEVFVSRDGRTVQVGPPLRLPPRG